MFGWLNEWLPSRWFRSADPVKRVEALAAMVKAGVGYGSALRRVLAALNDPASEVRQAAAQALGTLGDKSAVPALLVSLNDSDQRVREAAVRALGNLRDGSAVTALAAALEEPEPAIRVAACEALGTLGEASAVPHLLAAFRRSAGDGGGENEIAGSLARLGAYGELLAEYQSDPSPDSSRRDVIALAMLEHADHMSDPAPFIAALGTPDNQVRRLAAKVLAKGKHPAGIKALVAALNSRDFELRALAATELDRPGVWSPSKPEQQVLLAIAKGHPEEAAKRGVYAVEPILAALDCPVTPQGPNRLALLTALGAAISMIDRMHRDGYCSLILPFLGQDKCVEERRVAAEVLKLYGGAKHVDALVSALDDRDTAVRSAAAAALGRLRSYAAFYGGVPDMLVAAVARHSNPDDLEEGWRFEVASALRQFEDARAWPILADLLGSQQQVWRERAENTLLECLRGPSAKLREEVAQVLHTRGWQPCKQEDRVALAAGLNQWDAVIAEGQWALGFLKVLVARGDQRSDQAFAALCAIGGPYSVGPLLSILQEGRIDRMEQARRVLAGIALSDAIQRVGDEELRALALYPLAGEAVHDAANKEWTRRTKERAPRPSVFVPTPDLHDWVSHGGNQGDNPEYAHCRKCGIDWNDMLGERPTHGCPGFRQS